MPVIVINRFITISCYASIKSKLQHPPPLPPLPGKPRAFDYFLSPGSGEFDFCLGGLGKLERKCKVQMSVFFFFLAPKSLTSMNTCLDEMEEFKGRDIAIS